MAKRTRNDPGRHMRHHTPQRKGKTNITNHQDKGTNNPQLEHLPQPNNADPEPPDPAPTHPRQRPPDTTKPDTATNNTPPQPKGGTKPPPPTGNKHKPHEEDIDHRTAPKSTAPLPDVQHPSNKNQVATTPSQHGGKLPPTT
ncbi:hypothetical protein PYCCODRAFT_1467000 [Trametes coccinea BRFM310]|uniref:Uncharacterized protein n=1 Tax=Trametes coccinea (strain BRFM310) TaxID=1353009 RepID=A0A1Y2ITV6_TRAC3|nr:hypothetical protein PYCCODRAFT_1467000 [Trametes coccinea BRFM310]